MQTTAFGTPTGVRDGRTAMSEHYAVVKLDTVYLERLAAIRPVTDEDRADAWSCWIECSDPASCPGWTECPESHEGFDPEDEESPAFDEYEDVMIHGVSHNWEWGWNWTVPYEGCPVKASDHDTPDGVVLDGPRRYLLETEWEDEHCYLTVVRELEVEEA